MDTELLKTKIEKMDKSRHIEILKIIRKYPAIKINENKNGIYINMHCITKLAMEEISKYCLYVGEQECSLNILENEKKEIRKTFFN